MRSFWPTAKSEAPLWTSKRAFISVPYQSGMRCGTKKTKISLAVVEICVESSMRAMVRERYLINCGWRRNSERCEEVRRFSTEDTEERRRTQGKTRLPQRRRGR